MTHLLVQFGRRPPRRAVVHGGAALGALLLCALTLRRARGVGCVHLFRAAHHQWVLCSPFSMWPAIQWSTPCLRRPCGRHSSFSSRWQRCTRHHMQASYSHACKQAYTQSHPPTRTFTLHLCEGVIAATNEQAHHFTSLSNKRSALHWQSKLQSIAVFSHLELAVGIISLSLSRLGSKAGTQTAGVGRWRFVPWNCLYDFDIYKLDGLTISSIYR